MATQYTPILQLALPVTGELNGTWGDVVNNNITSMVEEAIAGKATISTWTANSHTLTTADGVTDEARCAMLVAETGAGGTALTGAGQIICPARTKLFVVSNTSAYAVTLKTLAGTGVAVPAGDTAFLFCDGTNVKSCVTTVVNGHVSGNLTVDGNTTLGDNVSDTVTINGTATFANANPTLSQGTANRVLFLNASKVVSDAAGLTWDGTTLSATKLAGALNGTVGATTPTTGVFTQVNIPAQGDLRLEDSSGGEFVALQAPAAIPLSYTLTMPVDDGTNGQVLSTDGNGVLSWLTPTSGVTSVSATAPISSSGGTTPTISLNASYGDTQNPYASKTANYILAAPNGAPGAPTFRAMVAADVPTLNQNTTGTAANIAGGAASQLVYQTAAGVTSFIPNGTAGQVLKSNGAAAPSWQAGNTGDVVGPASATDNAVARFDGTTGKIIKNSGVIIDDNNNMSGIGTLSATSLIVSGDITWTQSTDSYSRLSGIAATTPVVTDVHRNMRRCLVRDDLTVNYYLDPSNSALKEDGTSSVLTGADGQVMVQIPAFYVKFTPGANRNYAVSLLPAPGFVLHPAFMKDGAFVPFRYYGAYDACVFNGSVYESGLNYDNNWSAGQNWSADGAAAKLSSVSGVYPAVGATRANFRSMAANRGTGWREVDFYLEHAVQLLFLVEYGSFNSQSKLGDGNVSVSTGYPASSGNQTDSPHSVAGKSNSLGNGSTNTTSGASSGTRDTAFMSYRGIENWYGNCWNWVDGFNINNNQAYVSNIRSTFADDTATGYDSLGAPMVASDGWVTNVQQIPFGFLPSAVGGGSTTYLADYYYQNTGWRVAIFGGTADNGADAGAFYWYLSDGSGGLSRNVGGRLAA